MQRKGTNASRQQLVFYVTAQLVIQEAFDRAEHVIETPKIIESGNLRNVHHLATSGTGHGPAKSTWFDEFAARCIS